MCFFNCDSEASNNSWNSTDHPQVTAWPWTKEGQTTSRSCSKICCQGNHKFYTAYKGKKNIQIMFTATHTCKINVKWTIWRKFEKWSFEKSCFTCCYGTIWITGYICTCRCWNIIKYALARYWVFLLSNWFYSHFVLKDSSMLHAGEELLLSLFTICTDPSFQILGTLNLYTI